MRYERRVRPGPARGSRGGRRLRRDGTGGSDRPGGGAMPGERGVHAGRHRPEWDGAGQGTEPRIRLPNAIESVPLCRFASLPVPFGAHSVPFWRFRAPRLANFGARMSRFGAQMSHLGAQMSQSGTLGKKPEIQGQRLRAKGRGKREDVATGDLPSAFDIGPRTLLFSIRPLTLDLPQSAPSSEQAVFLATLPSAFDLWPSAFLPKSVGNPRNAPVGPFGPHSSGRASPPLNFVVFCVRFP